MTPTQLPAILQPFAHRQVNAILSDPALTEEGARELVWRRLEGNTCTHKAWLANLAAVQMDKRTVAAYWADPFDV